MSRLTTIFAPAFFNKTINTMTRQEYQTLPRSFRQYISKLYADVQQDIIDYDRLKDTVMHERAIGQRQMLRRLFGENLEYRFEVGDLVIANHPYVSEHGQIIDIASKTDVKVKLLDGQVVVCPIDKLEIWIAPKSEPTAHPSNSEWEERRLKIITQLLQQSGLCSLPNEEKTLATEICNVLRTFSLPRL